MDCKQKRMGIVGCFGQIENIKRQSLNSISNIAKIQKSSYLRKKLDKCVSVAANWLSC